MKVKICGIRTVSAAQVAVDARSNFLGFNFVRNSKRYIEQNIAKDIINAIGNKVAIVGVFQNEQIARVNEIGSLLNLDFVQLHGSEDNEYISQINFPVIKSIKEGDNPRRIKADYFLLDRKEQGKGEMVNSKVSLALAKEFKIFLAGGLTPENVGEVVAIIKPFAVDVAGGIETNGLQDLEKIKVFIQNAKGGDA